jgi:isocitrate dehydrogenase
MIINLNGNQVFISEINKEDYNRVKHNSYLYRHSIKYPINYGKLNYYFRHKDIIYKFKKSEGLSIIHKVTYECEVDKESLKRKYMESKEFYNLIELLQYISSKFKRSIIPSDLINPSKLITNNSNEDILLVVNWFKSENSYVNHPKVFILNIFNL